MTFTVVKMRGQPIECTAVWQASIGLYRGCPLALDRGTVGVQLDLEAGVEQHPFAGGNVGGQVDYAPIGTTLRSTITFIDMPPEASLRGSYRPGPLFFQAEPVPGFPVSALPAPLAMPS
jgi:hypothetical protein